MKSWLAQFYLNPQSYLYCMIDYVMGYWGRLLLLSSLIVLIYPLFYLIQQWDKNVILQKEQQRVEEELIQKEKLLGILVQKQAELKSKDSNITLLNEQIKKIMVDNRVEIENIQWQMEGEKRVMITVNQQANTLFKVLHILNALEKVNINEIQFIKLNRNKLVQLYLVLTFIE